MVSWSSYDDLDLDEIFQITDTDNARAPEMDEQAVAVRELLGRVRINLDKVDLARKRLGVAFQGLSSMAAADSTGALGDKTAEAEGRLGRHESVFAELASLARKTHAQLADLRGQRDAELERLRQDPADPRLFAEYGDWGVDGDPEVIEAAIRERFDAAARSSMGSSAEAYLAQVDSLKPVEPYDGPRRSAPAGGADGGGSAQDSAGPSMTRTASAAAPGSAGGPVLQGPGVVPAPAVGVAPPPAPGYLAPPGGYFVPPVPVTGPVLGARPTSAPAGAARTPSLRPGTTGFTKSVFGERPGKVLNSFGQRQPQPVVRPGPGMRPAALPGQVAGRGAPSGPGPVRPVPGRTAGNGSPAVKSAGNGTRTGGATSTAASETGTRGVPAVEHRAVGRVIRGHSERHVERAEFARRPKLSHGGTDGLNRPVVRNSRVPSIPAPVGEPDRRTGLDGSPPPARAPESELWPEGPGTVVPSVIRPRRDEDDGFGHDPGPFLTYRNLGRGTTGA